MRQRHSTWQYLIDWTNVMANRYGGTVWEGNKQWDWGQALCREIFGKDWMNDPEFQKLNDIPPHEPAPDYMIDAAKKWEAGIIPAWVDGGINAAANLDGLPMFQESSLNENSD